MPGEGDTNKQSKSHVNRGVGFDGRGGNSRKSNVYFEEKAGTRKMDRHAASVGHTAIHGKVRGGERHVRRTGGARAVAVSGVGAGQALVALAGRQIVPVLIRRPRLGAGVRREPVLGRRLDPPADEECRRSVFGFVAGVGPRRHSREVEVDGRRVGGTEAPGG
ncbi:hypothetical protein EYF80_011571 [Liparis tanakae]|uniref:Uncharacterized protein n=1 Tax=Liparis tanakae TaxID=230148 RepID=A0A4Z2IKM8_9TELE|nr:hypothetical protein EYF80_011571 [Liparis tanakae]